MLASNRQCRRTGLEKMEDDRLRTIYCLRGRLLSERVASKVAKEEADKMAKRLQELERRLVEEIKYRDRAEKKLKFAMKRLESVKISGGRDQMEMATSSVSSSSSQGFLGHQVFDEMPGSMNIGLDQCGLQEDVKRTKSSLGSENLLCDDATVPSLEESWSSTGIAKQCMEVSEGDEKEDEGLSPKEWAIGESRRACYDSNDRRETSEKESQSEENMLALVPVSKPQDLEDGKPEVKDNVQGVLLALRNVKEQLLHSLRMGADIYSPRDFCADHRDSHRSPFCCRASH